MKRKLLALSLIGIFSMSSSYAWKIVYDPTNHGAQLNDTALTMLEWAKQATEMLNQLAQMKETYDSLTGIRDWKDLLANKELWDLLPEDIQSLKDTMNEAALSEILEPRDFEAFRTEQLEVIAQQMGMAEKVYNEAKSRIDEIERLNLAADTTVDMKGSLDLNNKVQIENARLLNQQLTLMAGMLEQETREKKLKEEQYERSLESQRLTILNWDNPEYWEAQSKKAHERIAKAMQE